MVLLALLWRSYEGVGLVRVIGAFVSNLRDRLVLDGPLLSLRVLD